MPQCIDGIHVGSLAGGLDTEGDAQALVAIGIETKPVVSALTQALYDEEDQVRDAANQALKRLADTSRRIG